MIGNKRGEGNRKDRVEKVCQHCSKVFFVHPYRIVSAVCCSRKCARQIQIYTDERKEKMRKAMTGRNTKFGDGIPMTPLRLRIRMLPEYVMWRTHVFQRDNYTCQDDGCGKTKCELNADHIIPFSVVLQMYTVRTVEDARACEFLWDIRNGRTLCTPCHRKTPTYAGRGLKRVKI